jgi:hypothetical protein
MHTHIHMQSYIRAQVGFYGDDCSLVETVQTQADLNWCPGSDLGQAPSFKGSANCSCPPGRVCAAADLYVCACGCGWSCRGSYLRVDACCQTRAWDTTPRIFHKYV